MDRETALIPMPDRVQVPVTDRVQVGIRGVIFDLGSTLMYLDGEWEEVRARSVADMLAFLRAEGLNLGDDAFSREFHHQREKAYEIARATRVEYPLQRSLRETLVELGHPSLDGRLLAEGAKALFRYEETKWTLFPDTLLTLEALLETGYRLGLISNASDDAMIQRMLRRLELEPFLHPALNSAGVGIRKPDPRIFQLVLEEWGLEPGEVVMVGNTLEADILGAQLTGMRSILALMDENPANDEVRDRIIPDATIEALAQLPPLLITWEEEGF
ncbi:MAG: HAD family hydrolase [Chloroflexota bacterium]|nr:HAD family hydrolase [Chloroflexota bacterium]